MPSLMALPCLNAVAQRLNNSLSRASWRDTRVCFNRCTRRVSAGARRANVQPRSYWMWQRTIQLLSEEPRHEERSRILGEGMGGTFIQDTSVCVASCVTSVFIFDVFVVFLFNREFTSKSSHWVLQHHVIQPLTIYPIRASSVSGCLM